MMFISFSAVTSSMYVFPANSAFNSPSLEIIEQTLLTEYLSSKPLILIFSLAKTSIPYPLLGTGALFVANAPG